MCEAKFRGPDGRAVHMKVVHTTPPTPANPKNPEALEVGNKGDESGRLVSPHPTRRPVQFHYSKRSREDRVVGTTGNSGKENESWGTIYLDDSVDFSPFDGKEDEAVVYEVYSGGEEEELEEQFDKMEQERLLASQEAGVSTASNNDRVIHVYPCSACQIMFTSRSVMEQHYETCQQRQTVVKEEPVAFDQTSD